MNVKSNEAEAVETKVDTKTTHLPDAHRREVRSLTIKTVVAVAAAFLGLNVLSLVGIWFSVDDRIDRRVDDEVAAQIPKLKQIANELDRSLPELRAFVRTLPIGTILSVIAPDAGDDALPVGWVWCDGKAVTIDHPQLHDESVSIAPEWMNRHAPDLRGRFLKGAVSTKNLGTNSGKETLEGLAVGAAGSHEHAAPMRTGLIASKGPAAGSNRPYSIRDDHGNGWTVATHHLSVDGKKNDGEGQHRHELGGTIDGGQHRHQLPPITVDPPHVSVRFMIRVGKSMGTGR